MTAAHPPVLTALPALPPAGTTATVVFAVRRSGAADQPPGTQGLPGGGPLRLLALPGTALAAVVQAVPAADFTEEALRRRLADARELETCARIHHAVVTAAAAHGPVVPLPLATLFTGDSRAAVALAGQEARFAAALDRVAGRAEWAVKVHVTQALASPDTGEGSGPDAGTGAAYLARVRGRERERRSRQDAIGQVTRRVHATALSFAAASVRRPPHGAAVTGRERRQVLNAAYLVDEVRAADLVAAVRELAGDRGGLGVHVDVSGPWVPYSFTGEAEADTAGGEPAL
ncbi:GvpL/GvpF family gas vesicle protein [Streptomyces sp. NPDC021224]|uniref:GvpL/GvpF family gas vesicle protein n=1 Tax=unclassified Streptomyces TaxID=2593676 RepID=UPI0037973F81